MKRVLSLAFTVFVVGGLLCGTVAIGNLVALDHVRSSSRDSTVTSGFPTSVPTAAVQPKLPYNLAPAPIISPALSEAIPSDNGWWFLYVVAGNLWEAGGGTGSQLTRGAQVSQPAFRDDGLVLISRARNGSDVLYASPSRSLEPITSDTSPIVSQNHWAGQPAFVPGKERLYVTGDFNKSSTGPGSLAIWEVGLQEQGAIQVTTPPAYAGGDQDVSVNPEDARQIIFTRYSYVGSQLVEQLEWMDISREQVVPLTPADQPSRQPIYSPDGGSVAFIQAGSGSNQDLYVGRLQMSAGRAELQDVQQIASGVISNPAWSPDGSSLAYIELTRDQFQLWTVDVQTRSSRQVTTGPTIDATSRPVVMTRDQAANIRTWLTPPSARS